MGSTAAALLGVTLLVAAVDWWAVNDEERRPVEIIAKPLTLVLLIAAALAVEPADGTVKVWFVAALVFSLAGDVFLLLEEKYFVFGLGAFLVGHLAYIGGFLAGGHLEAVGATMGVGLVIVMMLTVGRSIFESVRLNEPELMIPVIAYMGVISAMVVSAIASKNTWAIVGALLFYASDALIAWNKFIEERPWGRVEIIVTYHLGQLALVLSLA